jgi:hypothetical protein
MNDKTYTMISSCDARISTSKSRYVSFVESSTDANGCFSFMHYALFSLEVFPFTYSSDLSEINPSIVQNKFKLLRVEETGTFVSVA